MRRYYRKPYQNSKALAGAPRRKKALQLPEWDSTQHDLSTLKLTPEQLERRHQERISRHHISLTASAARKANERITGATADGSECAPQEQRSTEPVPEVDTYVGNISCSSSSSSDSESDAMRHDARQRYQQRYREELAAFRHELEASSDSEDAVLLDIGNQNHQQQQQHAEDKGHMQQRASAPAASVHNASRPHKRTSGTTAATASTNASKFDADEAFHEQVQELQQQLSEERAANAQLRTELHEYMAHAGSVIAQLQQQMQQLSTAAAARTEAPSPPKRQQQQQQEQHSRRGTADGGGSPRRPGMGAMTEGDASQQATGGQTGARYSALYPAPWQPSRPAAGAPAHAAQHASAAAAATSASPQQRLARFYDERGAAPALAATAEQAVLPSYVEMRRNSAAATASTAHAAGAWSFGALANSPQRGGAQGHPANALRSSTASITDLFSRPVPGPSERGPGSRPGTAPAHDPTATLLSVSAPPPHQRWSNAAQAAFVVSSSAARAGTAAADGQPPPALAANSASSMPGLSDVDRHLGQGLPRAAVSRLHAQAHHFEPVPLNQQYLHPAEAWRTLSLNAHVAAARAGREGAPPRMR